MPARIAGMVLRARNREASVKFYEALGLLAHEHEHGGPKHFEVGPNAEGIVLELYQGSVNFSENALMIEVDSLNDALHVCERFGITPYEEIKEKNGMRFTYIFDLDLRSTMLIEKLPKPAS